MAYKVYCDDDLIYDLTTPSLYLISPKLKFEDNTSGSFEFTIAPMHPKYSSINRMTSTIKVYDDSELIFEGRIISEKTDFYKQRVCTCEGCLAYLNDTYQPLHEYSDVTVYNFINSILNIHNTNVADNRKIYIGAISVHGDNNSIHVITNYETTMECIKKNLVETKLGGHLRIRWSNGNRYLDYLDDFPNTSNQKIEFGSNLLDYAEDYDLSTLATVIIPRGARLDESPIENADAYVMVDSVNSGSIYVTSTTAVNTYGWIEQVVDWEDEISPSTLLSKARTYLADTQFEEMVLSVKAADLHMLNPSIDKFRLLDYVRVVSPPHGMDRNIAITAIDLPLDQPDQVTYTMGTRVNVSMTSRSKSVNSKIMNRIAAIPTKQSVLKEAKANATALIHSALNGHVVITDDATELLIMDTDDKETATKVWRWNLNGLGYSKSGYNGEYGLAMTMDGAIVADFITTGTLDANLIRTGVLKDTNGNTSFNLTTGEFTMKKGSINIGNGTFKVDTYGNLTASSALLNGSVTAGTNSGSKIQLAGGQITGYYNGSQAGRILMTGTFSGTAAGSGMMLVSDYIGLSGQLLTCAPGSGVYQVGQTRSLTFVSSLTQDENGKHHWTTSTVQFTNGLITSRST